MINRTLVRTHVVRELFAFYKDGDKSLLTAQKELLLSFNDTYNLYLLLLDLPNELVRHEEQKIEVQKEKAAVLHQDYKPNLNFVNNKLAAMLFDNSMLRQRLQDAHISWEAAYNNIDLIYKEITQSELYKEYQAINAPTFEQDKQFLKRVYIDIIAATPELENALEEIELHQGGTSMFLEADINVVLSFVIKTIKRFNEDSDSTQPILEMFDQEEEVEFSKKLLRKAIENRDEYMQLIDQKLQNWDPDRIAYMDRIIMQVALAEIFHFPDIAIEVTMNEYIEVAKEYSSDSSGAFINGILDQIASDLKRENKLIKTMTLR